MIIIFFFNKEKNIFTVIHKIKEALSLYIIVFYTNKCYCCNKIASTTIYNIILFTMLICYQDYKNARVLTF